MFSQVSKETKVLTIYILSFLVTLKIVCEDNVAKKYSKLIWMIKYTEIQESNIVSFDSQFFYQKRLPRGKILRYLYMASKFNTDQALVSIKV